MIIFLNGRIQAFQHTSYITLPPSMYTGSTCTSYIKIKILPSKVELLTIIQKCYPAVHSYHSCQCILPTELLPVCSSFHWYQNDHFHSATHPSKTVCVTFTCISTVTCISKFLMPHYDHTINLLKPLLCTVVSHYYET